MVHVANLAVPRRTYIGGGTVDKIAVLLAELGIAHPLIVTDPFMVKSGMVRAILDPLEAAGIPAGVFSDTISDPTDTVIEAGVTHLREGGHDGMIGFGGGSPIDTAKAMGVLFANRGKMRDYKVPHPIPRPGLPIVAVPTTAGTGSEVTRFTVIGDTETDEKMLIAGASLVPQGAIVDYELTMKLPPRLTADTGIDALVHAVEAYVSQKRNSVASMYAVDAMQRIAPHLRRVYADASDREAREQMMLGATQAGLAFSTASVALVHGMSRPLGAHFHVHHGMSNAMLFPAVSTFSIPAATAEYAACARACGWATPSDADEKAARSFVEELESLNRDLEVPTPAQFGIEEARYRELMPLMADQALASGSPNNNPRVPTKEEILSIYEGIYSTSS
ncbi:MAG: iron-containing alcohol dehydrogenase [Myxococcota bacterium]